MRPDDRKTYTLILGWGWGTDMKTKEKITTAKAFPSVFNKKQYQRLQIVSFFTPLPTPPTPTSPFLLLCKSLYWKIYYYGTDTLYNNNKMKHK